MKIWSYDNNIADTTLVRFDMTTAAIMYTDASTVRVPISTGINLNTPSFKDTDGPQETPGAIVNTFPSTRLLMDMLSRTGGTQAAPTTPDTSTDHNSIDQSMTDESRPINSSEVTIATKLQNKSETSISWSQTSTRTSSLSTNIHGLLTSKSTTTGLSTSSSLDFLEKLPSATPGSAVDEAHQNNVARLTGILTAFGTLATLAVTLSILCILWIKLKTRARVAAIDTMINNAYAPDRHTYAADKM